MGGDYFLNVDQMIFWERSGYISLEGMKRLEKEFKNVQAEMKEE